MLDLGAAEKAVPRLAHVMGKVYQKKIRFFCTQEVSERRGIHEDGEFLLWVHLWRSAEHIPTRIEGDISQPSES